MGYVILHEMSPLSLCVLHFVRCGYLIGHITCSGAIDDSSIALGHCQSKTSVESTEIASIFWFQAIELPPLSQPLNIPRSKSAFLLLFISRHTEAEHQATNNKSEAVVLVRHKIHSDIKQEPRPPCHIIPSLAHFTLSALPCVPLKEIQCSRYVI